MVSTVHKSLTISFLAVSIFISGLSADLVSAQSSAPEPMVTLTAEEQAWLAAHPDIALGAPTTYPPFVIKRNDGTHVGMLVDYLEAVSRLLNHRIRLHIEDPWTKVQERAANREIDGLALGGRAHKRKALYNATEPIFKTYDAVYSRNKDEYQIKQFSDLDGMRIGYREGSKAALSVLEKLPNATLIPYVSNEDLTQALLSKDVEVVVAWVNYAHWLKENMLATINNIYIIEEHPQEYFTHIRKDWPELVSILNKTIIAMEQDELPRIMNKWFIEWPERPDVSGIQLTPQEKAWLEAHPDVTFGFTDSFEPFLIRGVRGQHTGILVDLLKELNSQLGTQFTLEVDSWPVILEKVRKKEMGGVLGVAYRTADAFVLLKTVPYYTVYPAFFAREDAPFAIKSLDDLRGKSVAILDNAKVMESILEPYGSDIDISRYPDNRTPLQLVFEGKVDLAFGLSIHAYYINKYGLLGVKPLHTLLERPSKVGMAVRTDWPELVSILNKTIVAIREDALPRIMNKWYIDWPERPKAPSVQLTPEEKDWLAQNNTVRVRFVDYPPYQILQDNKPPQGIAIEYLKLIEARTGIKFKYEATNQPFAEFIESMKQGKGPDMTALITPTPEREPYLSFTKPYLSSPYVIFIREEDNPILDIQGLAGKTVAVPRGFVVQEQLESNYPKIKPALFDSDEKALKAVAIGQADAYIGNLAVASHIIHQKGLSHLKVTATAPFGNQDISMGTRRDLPELTSIIDKALASITEEEKTAIRNKYLAIKFEQGINKAEVMKWALIVGGTAAGVIFLFVFWNARLSKETRMRKESEAQLRGFLERMPIAACLVDKQENMYYHNKRFIDLFGYKHEEIKTLSDWWPKAYPDDQYRQYVIETWSDCVRRSEEKGTDIEAKEYRVTCKDGQVREMEISGIVLGDRYLATLIDNTERNRAKDQQVAAKEAAEAANQAKSIFLASMSHELRTPLNAILGFSGMLARGKNATSDQQQKLSIINRSGQHLLSMINDVLDLSKIEAGRIELQEDPFDLVALVKEIGVIIQSRANAKGLSVVLEAESISVPYVKADMGKLRQILINLLGNAVKFTDEGGVTIRCTTEPIPQEPKHCHIVIEVEDTGPGIDPSRQAQIFEPFMQGSDAHVRKGTGLGLSICKKYADFMGGTIELESEVGKGSIFRVRLPAENAEAADVKIPVDDKLRVVGLTPTQKTWRILIADDNRENLLLMKSLLEEVGFVVIEAENGQEAVAAFKKESPDLVWMDMRMPVMDGYEAVRHIRQCSGGDTVPIIAVTASAFREQRQDILAAGCNDMVIKPFQAQEIFEVMGRFLDIEYICEQEPEAAPDRVSEVELTAAMLADLPEELLEELRETSLSLDRETISVVIERIESLAPDTAKGLRILLDDYKIGRIRHLLGEIYET
jgi:two-component system sensor histidine kinase EvgS